MFVGLLKKVEPQTANTMLSYIIAIGERNKRVIKDCPQNTTKLDIGSPSLSRRSSSIPGMKVKVSRKLNMLV